jgi:hypothetical protein
VSRMLSRIRQWLRDRGPAPRLCPVAPGDGYAASAPQDPMEDWTETTRATEEPAGVLGRPEESQARELHRVAAMGVARRLSGVGLSLEGEGVRWQLTATRAGRQCLICVFGEPAPHYLVYFRQDEKGVASGYTPSRGYALAAVSQWLEGSELGLMHRGFSFVQQRRYLEGCRDDMIAHSPSIQEVESVLLPGTGDDAVLAFRDGDRACSITPRREDQSLAVALCWDRAALCSLETDRRQLLATAVERWVHDHAMPSRLQSDLPGLEVGELARYYEEGRPVEGEFLLSWDQVERRYRSLQPTGGYYPLSDQVLEFIAAIREAGYDKTLRAGRSFWNLVVSRSRRHGLRPGQPRVAFVFRERPRTGMDAHVDGRKKLSSPCIALTARVDAILRQLVQREID